jgi:Uma2 family endonuclease
MAALAQLPPKLTVEEFLAFYDTRPDEEQWQLVDGVALLMTPPFVIHQLIASNLQSLLNGALQRHAPHLWAGQRVGIELLPQFPHYRPEPDVVVIDREIAFGQRHVERFYLPAEILSDSDDERIELKRGFYRGHEHNRAILLVRQDIMEVELDRRTSAGWTTETLRGAEATLRLDEFGLLCRLADLYHDTPVSGG